MSDYPSDLDCPTSDDAAGVGLASIIVLICLGSCANMSVKQSQPAKEPVPQVQKCVAHHSDICTTKVVKNYMTLVR